MPPDEGKHEELIHLGTAVRMAWWRYGGRLGCLGAILITIVVATGNREQGWWERLPHPWGTVTGWTCFVLFWIFVYSAIRSRPRQPCRYCGASFSKVTLVDSQTVGSMDQLLLRCEACGRQWLWEGSP